MIILIDFNAPKQANPPVAASPLSQSRAYCAALGRVMSVFKKTWVVGMLAVPLVFLIINGMEPSLVDSGPFYGLVLILSGFPMSGLAVDFYSTMVGKYIFISIAPSYESQFYFYQSNIQWFIYWLFAFISGYFQWFILLPWMLSKLSAIKNLTGLGDGRGSSSSS